MKFPIYKSSPKTYNMKKYTNLLINQMEMKY